MTEKATHTIVYLGRHWLNNKEIVGKFALLDAVENWQPSSFIRDNLSPKLTLFKTSGIKYPLIIGGIYNVKAELGENGKLSTIQLGTLQYLSRMDHAELIGQCEIEDRGAYAMQQRNASMKKIQSDKSVMNDIARLRKMYQNQHPAHRDAFEMGLLALLRSTK